MTRREMMIQAVSDLSKAHPQAPVGGVYLPDLAAAAATLRKDGELRARLAEFIVRLRNLCPSCERCGQPDCAYCRSDYETADDLEALLSRSGAELGEGKGETK